MDSGLPRVDPWLPTVEGRRRIESSRRSLIHPVHAFFKPLPVRAGISLYRWTCLHAPLYLAGFERRVTESGIVLWTRRGKGAPLFLLHGFGFGATPYVGHVLAHFGKEGRPIVLPEFPNILIFCSMMQFCQIATVAFLMAVIDPVSLIINNICSVVNSN